MDEKCCVTCKYYRDDWGTTCIHPKTREWDDVKGWVRRSAEDAVTICCKLDYWERKVALISWFEAGIVVCGLMAGMAIGAVLP